MMEAVWAKWRRAREGAAELDRLCDSWAEAHPTTVERGLDEAGWHTWWAQPLAEQPPLELAVRLGEVVHNLRSALDHLVYGLVIANGKAPTRHNYFPVAMSAAAWSTATGKDLRGLRAQCVDAIHQWQPYRRAADPKHDLLAVLHELSLVDKHRLVYPLGTVVGANQWEFNFTSGDVRRMRNITVMRRQPDEKLQLTEPQWLVKAHVADATAPGVDDSSMDIRLNLASVQPDIAFGTPEPFRVAMNSHATTLLVELVEGILRDLEHLA